MYDYDDEPIDGVGFADPGGFECIGESCPSNDHTNGDRIRTPHPHKDGGYALRQRWM